MTYALASEYDRLSPDQKDRVTHIIIDDGEWTQEQIDDYIHLQPRRWKAKPTDRDLES